MRDAILKHALDEAGLEAVPERGSVVSYFLKVPVRFAIARRLGEDVARELDAQLATMVERAQPSLSMPEVKVAPFVPRTAPVSPAIAAKAAPARAASPPPATAPGASPADDAAGGKMPRRSAQVHQAPTVGREALRALLAPPPGYLEAKLTPAPHTRHRAEASGDPPAEPRRRGKTTGEKRVTVDKRGATGEKRAATGEKRAATAKRDERGSRRPPVEGESKRATGRPKAAERPRRGTTGEASTKGPAKRDRRTAPPEREVLLLSSDENAAIAISQMLVAHTETRVIQNVSTFVDALAPSRRSAGKLSIIIDCERPSVHLVSLVALAAELPAHAKVILWRASTRDIAALGRGTELWRHFTKRISVVDLVKQILHDLG